MYNHSSDYQNCFIVSGYSQALNICNLDAILTYLKEGHYSSSNWKDLGLKLGLYDTTLNDIESNYSKVENRLRECIAKWLQRGDGVDAKGGANWTTLAKALEQCGSKPTAEHISKYKNLLHICTLQFLISTV